ncbi:LysR family transcriptional regulator [Streptomyces tubercidicus]|uniref:LysR family transcriptional regulator n=1 Tax=Streptomyces tubercidicus TaxID=47759 RepID=UPI00367A2C5C
MKLNLHRLWVFEQVVECGGFSAAARKLFMSQPAVSQQVRKLEVDLRTTLIERSAACLRLTDQGEVLFRYARQFSVLSREAVVAVESASDARAGRLTVGGTTTYGAHLLPPLLAQFAARFPGVVCNLRVGNTAQISSQLADGEIQLALLPCDPESAPHLALEAVLTERLLLVAHPSHPMADRVMSPSVLEGSQFLFREPGSATRRAQEDALERWCISPASRSQVWGNEAVKHAVMAGLGVALLSERSVAGELRAGRLALIEPEFPLPAHTVVIASRHRPLRYPAEQAFAELLRTLADGSPLPPTCAVADGIP